MQVFPKKFINKYRILWIILIISIIIILFANRDTFHFHQINELQKKSNGYSTDDLVFGDNITGYPYNVVPNIVHYVLFSIHEIQFGHYISILSVLKNQKPDQILIHCDCDQLVGEYYKRVLKIAQKTKTKIRVRKIEKPKEIFGRPLSERWVNWHASDITRIKVLIEFGGIYLDRDVYVVKSLDKFRKYEMTLNCDDRQLIGNQVLIARSNARFLKQWLDSYHIYDSSKWYYNAGEVPTILILNKNPEFVHRVKVVFGADAPRVCPKVYSIYYPNWQKEFYTIHLVLRGNEISFKDWCFRRNKPPIMKFDEEIALKLNVTFGEMYRLLFDYTLKILN